MIVRSATADDIPTLVSMGKAFLEETGLTFFSFDPETMTASFQGLLATPTAVVLVAEREGIVIGGTGATTTTTLFNHSELLAQELFWYVRPADRGSAGMPLFLALRQWARRAGAHAFSVAAMASSPTGVERFYRRAGFRRMENTWIMEL